MAPTILAGDMVICSPLDNHIEMLDNEIYAYSDQSIGLGKTCHPLF